MACNVLCSELALHHHLCGDTGVIRTRLPQRVVAHHAVVAGQSVHHRVVKAVSHVQAAGDVRRWNHDGVGLAGARGFEIALFLPFGVPAGFKGVGLVSFFHGDNGRKRQKMAVDYTRALIESGLVNGQGSVDVVGSDAETPAADRHEKML